MRTLLPGSLIFLVVGACGGGSKKPASEPVVENKQSATVAEAPPPLTDTQRVMAKMEEFERALCACVNRECVQKVNQDMTKWAQAEAAKQTEPPKTSEADQKRYTEIGIHMAECMQKAMSQP